MKKEARRVKGFPESVIREMTREAEKYDAVNLSQGYPGYPIPKNLMEAVVESFKNKNQYSVTWGLKGLREYISRKLSSFNGLEYDPEKEITVTCGTSEALMSSVLAHVEKGDEVLIFQPFYENYVPAVSLASGKPVFTSIDRELRLDREDLKSKISNNTKAIILNTPHNPSGKVFEREELELIRDLCVDNDIIVFADEIYERIIFEGKHISIAGLDGMRERTVTLNGFSKTYSVTGWRVGYAAATEELMRPIRKVHDYTTICAPTPFQHALQVVEDIPEEHYKQMVSSYKLARDYLFEELSKMEFKPILPHGAYYMLAGIDSFDMNDLDFAKYLVKEKGVAVVPGSSFYNDDSGDDLVRFSFSVGSELLEKAVENMKSDTKNI